MSSSRTITLFAQPTQTSQKPTSFMVSILVHAAVVGLVSLAFMYAPRIDYRASRMRYTLDRVDLNSPDSSYRHSGGSSDLYPLNATKAHPKQSSGSPSALPSNPQVLAKLKADQTLLQPLIPKEQLLTKTIPVPAMLLWKPPTVRVKTITPPPPHPSNTAELKPLINRPNLETNLAELQVSSTAFKSRITLVKPSTTTPVVVHGPQEVLSIPETTSVATGKPATAAVLSVSNMQMAHGTAMLPPANEAAPGTSSELSQGGGKSPNGQGTGAGAGGHENAGKDMAAKGDGDQAGGGKGKSQPGKSGAGAGTGTGTGASQGSGHDPGPDDGRSYARITLPKTGQFGVVVVGSTMDDEYPETAQVWKGRLTYSVYLHVGMAKSWILQYSLPRTADVSTSGNANHIEAPWPYYIVRPNLADGDVNADALMVRGVVNETGRFESLAVVFPSDFTQRTFVLDALHQWQFRPATQNGKPARVEILLIIPGDSD